MFAKVGAMHMLGVFLGQGRIVMTPAIHFMRDIIERGKVMYEVHHACMVALRESQGSGSDQLSSGNPAMP
jgi:hypothetical protein